MTQKNPWRTAISRFSSESVEIAGYKHEELMRKVDFAGSLFVLYQQRMPRPAEAKLLNAMLISVVDHSIVASSAVTRIVAASGVPLQASVAEWRGKFGAALHVCQRHAQGCNTQRKTHFEVMHQ